MPRKGFRPPRSRNGPTGRDNSTQSQRVTVHYRFDGTQWIRREEPWPPEASRKPDLRLEALRWGEGVNVAWTAPFRWNERHGLESWQVRKPENRDRYRGIQVPWDVYPEQ